jgi:hypothetical protein
MEKIDDTLGILPARAIEATILKTTILDPIKQHPEISCGSGPYGCQAGCEEHCECDGYGCELYS